MALNFAALSSLNSSLLTTTMTTVVVIFHNVHAVRVLEIINYKSNNWLTILMPSFFTLTFSWCELY